VVKCNILQKDKKLVKENSIETWIHIQIRGITDYLSSLQQVLGLK
jgi:hypothetical protein